MGLLDQVLGQVTGQQGSANQPGGGGLGGQLGSFVSGPGGKIALAALAYLASKNMSSGAGGYGSVLHDMFAGHHDQPTADNPTTSASHSTGSFLDQIGGMLGGASSAAGGASTGGTTADGETAGGLGGMLNGGLGELQNRFQQNGGGDFLQSWIGSGSNQSVSPGQLEQSLGSDTIDHLSQRTGMDRGDLLGQLSQALPQLIDKLTPHGRMPG